MSKRVYSFGPFQLDTAEQVLLRDGQALALKPKFFELLVVLVENSGRVVCKDELLKLVWADSFVEEGNVAVSICEIRKALGGRRNGHTYIETVPRRGYRFVARVTEVSVERALTGNSLNPAHSNVAGGVGGDAAAGKATVAVLPFKSIGSAADEYLGLGMADALITRLSNLTEVTIRPTSSVRKYSDSVDPVLAGQELRVEWVLDGIVQKARKRIRLTVQLVNVHDGVSVWAEKFDERLTDIFELEDSISEQVVTALAVRLSGHEKSLLVKRYTENAEAYQAYLKGHYFLDKRTVGGCKKGIRHFEQAIMIDPNYALAYAGLAHCFIALGDGKMIPSKDCYARAENAIIQALRLGPDLAEVHASLGHLKTRKWDWAGAEIEFKSAIEQKPNHALAHIWYALFLGLRGRCDEAFVEIKMAQGIDPLSLALNSTIGSLLYIARRYDEAIEQFHLTLELDDGFSVAHFCLGYTYEALGEYEKAVAAYQQSRKGLGTGPELLACLGRIHALAGRKEKAHQTIGELMRQLKKHYVPYSIALIHTALGDTDEAFQWLEKAFAGHDEDLFLLKIDPRVDSLRHDPRFESLLQRIGLVNMTAFASSE